MGIEKLFGQSIIWRGVYFVTALLTNILLSRYLQAALSGSVLYLANIFSFIALVLGVGLDSGLTFFASRRFISYRKLVTFSALWVVAVAIIGWLSAGFFLHQFFSEPAQAIAGAEQYAVYYTCGLMMMSFFAGLFYSKSNFWLPNLLYSIINIAVVIAIPLLGYFYENRYGPIIDVYFYSTFLQGLILLPAFLLTYKEPATGYLPSVPDTKKLLRFSVLALGANIIFFLINRVDFYFVEKYWRGAPLGNYILVSRLGQMLLFFPQVLASVIFPQAAENKDGSNMIANTLIIGRLLSRFYVFIFIATAITGYWVFPLVFGHSFTSMYGLLLIFLPGFFALSHLAVISAFFLGNGQLKVNISGTAIALFIVVSGDVLVVQKYGVYAAAAVSALAFIGNFAYSAARFRHKYNVALTDLFAWQKQDLQLLKQMFTRQPLKKASA